MKTARGIINSWFGECEYKKRVNYATLKNLLRFYAIAVVVSAGAGALVVLSGGGAFAFYYWVGVCGGLAGAAVMLKRAMRK